MAVNFDPVEHGYVESLARPGANVTGVYLRLTELAPKQLELLIDTFPGKTRLGVLWDAHSADQFRAAEAADKMRSRTGLSDDGSTLVDRALSGDIPMLAINTLKTESERSEQRGFSNLVKGAFGMFRNTTAHAPRVHWPMQKADAEDLLSLVSLIHRRLDEAHMPPRP